jgi:hypothetical protein
LIDESVKNVLKKQKKTKKIQKEGLGFMVVVVVVVVKNSKLTFFNRDAAFLKKNWSTSN